MHLAKTIITVACGTASAIALQKSVLNLAKTPDIPPPPKPDGTQANRDEVSTPRAAIATPERLSVDRKALQAQSKPANQGNNQQPGQKSASKAAIDAELAQVDARIARVPQSALTGLRPLPTLQVPRTTSSALASSQNRVPDIAMPERVSSSQGRGRQGSGLPTQKVPLGDVQGHWAQAAVEALASGGIVQGFTDGSFRPNQAVTAAEFAVMARKAFRESPVSYRDLQAQISDRVATRADAAVFIYQQLARAEQSPSNTTVQIIGEVERPGAYTLAASDARLNQSIPTVTQAIQQAGGARSTANLRRVQIHRAVDAGAKQIIDVNVWQLLQTGDLTQDVMLQQGDKLVIPAAPATNQPIALSPTRTVSTKAVKVSILGAVNNPGMVEVLATAPLHQALQKVGGASQNSQSTIQLIRFNPNGSVSHQMMTIDASTNAEPELHNNDILVVSHPDRAEAPVLSKPMVDLLSRVLPIAVS